MGGVAKDGMRYAREREMEWKGSKGKGRGGIKRGDGLRVIVVRFEVQYFSSTTGGRHSCVIRSYPELDFTLHFTILSRL